MVARGAKRPRSETRGLLQAFQPVTLSWAGAGELKTLLKAEWGGGLPLPRGAALLCGFYLNELLLKLLAREDPHPALFGDYHDALAALAAAQRRRPGGGAAAFRAAPAGGTGLRAAADARGRIHRRRHRSCRTLPLPFGVGPRALGASVAREPGARYPRIRGATLLGLAANAMPDAHTAAEAKRLMRDVLDHYLEERRIFSRRVVQDLQAIDEESEHRD